MKKLLLLFALVSTCAFAQSQDCRVAFTFSNSTGLISSTPIDNRQAGCDNWILQYQNHNVNPVSLTVESANATATCTGASYSAFPGTVAVGTNPATSITGTETRLTGYVGCIRVTATGTPAGTWTIIGVLYGFRSGFNSSTGSSGSPCPNPCPVVGTAADGAPVSGDPIQIGNIDSSGNIHPFFVCTLSAPITFTAASGSIQVVALSASKTIRICHISISANTATNLTLQYGTGSNCATGTTSLSGAYNNVTALALDLFGTLRVPASQALCINSSASITAGGLITYAQF